MAEPVVQIKAPDLRHRVEVAEVACLRHEVLARFRLCGAVDSLVTAARAESDRDCDGDHTSWEPRHQGPSDHVVRTGLGREEIAPRSAPEVLGGVEVAAVADHADAHGVVVAIPRYRHATALG